MARASVPTVTRTSANWGGSEVYNRSTLSLRGLTDRPSACENYSVVGSRSFLVKSVLEQCHCCRLQDWSRAATLCRSRCCTEVQRSTLELKPRLRNPDAFST